MAIRADEVDLARDRDLVERYQAGDPAAFDDLYQRYFERLRQFCQRRVGDPHEAEELAQEAFMRALRALPRFAGERRFYPWMTVIAQRLCVDHHRRLWRVSPEADIDTGVVVDEGHDALFDRVDLAYLSRALDRLAPRHREILDLREQQGWSYQQIADHLEVPITTVEALLHRARKALRREFASVTGGRLAGIPVAGWLVGHLTDLRNRLATRVGGRLPELGNLAAPVAAGAVTLALAVGPAISPDPSTPTPPPTTVATRGHPVPKAAPPPVPAPPATAPETDARTAPAPPPPTTAPPPAPPPPTEAAVGPARLRFNTEHAEAADQANVMSVGPVTIGVTPQNIRDSVGDVLDEPLSRPLSPGGDR